jgi:hypothetical protein
MAHKTIIDERIEKMWARTQKWLEEGTLARPVEVDLIETCLRGGDSCTIRMSW